MCRVSASASMASIAPGANATTTSAKRTWVVSTITATKIAEITIATANEPSPALTWLSRVVIFIRAKREPIRAPMPTSATPRIQCGRPPSTQPGAVQHAGADHRAEHPARRKFRQPQQQRDRDRGRDQCGQFERRGDRRTAAGDADGAIPVSASSSGSAAVRMITRMVCTTAIAGDVGALLDGEDGDLRQRAGAAGQQRRGLVPAVDALQIKAAAEGRAEGRERQQADGQRIGAHVLDQLPRHQRAQRYSEQHQHGLGQERRHRERPSGQRRDADRDHRAGDQPARQLCPQKQQAAGGADDERFQRIEDFGAVGKG